MPNRFFLTVLLIIAAAHSGAASYAISNPQIESIAGPTTKQLNTAFVIPPKGSRAFNSELWKSDTAARWSMLFQLGRMRLFNKSVPEVRALLGEPDGQPRRREWMKDTTDLYDLGTCEQQQVLLNAEYHQGALRSLTVLFCTDGRASASDFGWITRNGSGNQAATRINESFFLVGMPVNQLRNTLGRISQHLVGSRDHLMGQLQLHYSYDNSTVTRFRLYYRPSPGKRLVPSRWQTANLRADITTYQRLSGVSDQWCGTGIDRRLLIPDRKFTPEDWAKNCSMSRDQMLFDLCHSYPLVGMRREAVHKLLGLPTYPTKDGAVVFAYDGAHDKLTPSEKKCEWYCVKSPMICGTPPSTYLQIHYEGNRVTRYRLEPRNGGMTRPPLRVGSTISEVQPQVTSSTPVEQEVYGVTDELPSAPDNSVLLSIIDERFMRTGRSARTLALPGTVPPSATIPGTK